MLVIHMMKAVHSHPVPVSVKYKYGSHREHIVEAHAGHCKICDYQLARDADIATGASFLPAKRLMATFYAYYGGFYYSSCFTSINLRGPPPSC